MKLFSSFSSKKFNEDSIVLDFYKFVNKFKELVTQDQTGWGSYPTNQEYAKICYWALRKLEYQHAATSLIQIEKSSNSPLRVLDVGSGVVPLANWISSRGHKVYAIDPLAADIQFLSSHHANRQYNTTVKYAVAQGEFLPFPSQHFDVVTIISVLEHTIPGNDQIILNEIGRVLKPTGKIIFTLDVEPMTQFDNQPSSPTRKYTYPFTYQHLVHLLHSIAGQFTVDIASFPPDLIELSWDTVYGFWESNQIHDDRPEPRRYYLALGGLLEKTPSTNASSKSIIPNLLQGQTALMASYTEYVGHAEERLKVIEQLNQDKDELKIELSAQTAALLTTEQSLVAAKQKTDNLQSDLTAKDQALADLNSQFENQRTENAELQKSKKQLETEILAANQELIAKETIIQSFLTKPTYWLLNSPFKNQIFKRFTNFALTLKDRYAGIRLRFIPRLGNHRQYPPRQLTLPPKYYRPINLKTVSETVVSIVTPSYNQGEFIERTIHSVVSQNYPHTEYIIQDGASTDQTLKILQKSHSLPIKWQSVPDDGQAHALNLGFQKSTGDIMAYLNSDDIYLPGAIPYVVSYFEAHPNIDLVYGHRIIIDENDDEIGRWVLPPHSNAPLKWADFIPQETMFWRRSLWEKTGGYIDESYSFAMDWELLLRFIRAGAKANRLPRFLGAFRVYDQNKSSALIDTLGQEEMKRIRTEVHGREVDFQEINRNLKNYLRASVAYHLLYRAGIFRY